MRTSQTLAALVIGLLALPGCGGGQDIHPVHGKVELKDGDVRQLTDAHIELMLEGDPSVRASGLISSDGSFEVQMLHKGRVLRGVPAGKYQARLSFDAEVSTGKKGWRPPVRPQYLDFKTSGLSVTVPAPETITVQVTKR